MLKARFLYGVFTGGYAHLYIHRQYAESMKGGMLMKSKHCIYGKEVAHSTFNSICFDNTVSHKRTIAALCNRSAII